MAKAAALFIFLVVLEVIAVPAFGLLLLGPSLGPPLLGLVAVLALDQHRAGGDRDARVRDRDQDSRP